MDAPELYSHRWYQQQLTGMQHLLNRLSAEYDAQYQRIEQLAELVRKMEGESVARDAKVGELIARVESCEASVDKARKAYQEIKTKANGK